MSSYVVSGANRGLGLEWVNQLSADPNNQVFGLARNLGASEKLLELVKSKSNVHVFQADMVDVPALKAAAEGVAKVTGGSLDYLINNAAFVDDETTGHTVDAFPEESAFEQALLKSFNVNVVGVGHTTNAFLPLLKRGTTKKVITLSTGLADLDYTLHAGVAWHVPYSVSKAALNMLIVKYAARFKDEGFTFLAISPGLVNTSVKPPTPEQLEAFKSMVAQFQAAAPHWDGKPLTPEQSVKYMLDVIAKTSVKDSGTFVSHFGNKQWL